MAEFVCLPQPLERFVGRVCLALGADEDIAAEVAHHLVRANLSGHDSHGVLRLPMYVAQVDRGELLPAARPAVVRETAVAAVIDAGRGFGQFTTIVALEWAIARARRHGLAATAIRHSTHIGRLGEYTERAAAEGLVAIVTYGATGPNAGGVVPHGGRERRMGTNPWSFGVPAGDHPAMIFDAATSTIAEGKVRVALAKGAPLPPGAIVDREGQPSLDPADFYAGGALLPLGGATGGHKGYGLALASALIGGLAAIDDAAPGRQARTPGRVSGVFLLAIDPAAFGDRASYAAMVGEALAVAEQTPPAPGVEEVLVPGEPEVRMREARGRNGIVLPEATWQELRQIAERYSLPLDEVLRTED